MDLNFNFNLLLVGIKENHTSLWLDRTPMLHTELSETIAPCEGKAPSSVDDTHWVVNPTGIVCAELQLSLSGAWASVWRVISKKIKTNVNFEKELIMTIAIKLTTLPLLS
jgi:hypothetical protein